MFAIVVLPPHHFLVEFRGKQCRGADEERARREALKKMFASFACEWKAFLRAFSFHRHLTSHKLSSLNYTSQLLLQFISHVSGLFFYRRKLFLCLVALEAFCFQDEVSTIHASSGMKRTRQKNNRKFISYQARLREIILLIFHLCLACSPVVVLFACRATSSHFTR